MNNDNERLTLREVQLEELNILLKVTEFLDANNLYYCLCGGTMLGAVRHKGFIPWDDDIDLLMFREDFEKLRFRRDWREAKDLTLDQEAVRRVAIAKEEEAAAQRAVAETAENTRRTAEALETIKAAVSEGGY